MNTGNSFVQGRELAKKLAITAAVSCAAGVVLGFFNQLLQVIVTLFTIVVMVCLAIVIFKQCRCPHCGKVIAFGVLQVRQCPRCRRNLITGKKMKKR